MENDEQELTKTRQIEFSELHPDPAQAQTAALLLEDVEGVLEATAESPILLRLRYNLLQISLEQVETALTAAGFHISTRLMCAIKRALCYYTEETQRSNNGCPKGESNCTRKVFINRYQRRNHALRDPRPDHWRKYL
ncbi:MAG: hypothetical protein GY703_07780 [Gammaproteobacteria bacterium]|nr:hypothetical protein [Gammaproteobacteria bacterium]